MTSTCNFVLQNRSVKVVTDDATINESILFIKLTVTVDSSFFETAASPVITGGAPVQTGLAAVSKKAIITQTKKREHQLSIKEFN